MAGSVQESGWLGASLQGVAVPARGLEVTVERTTSVRLEVVAGKDGEPVRGAHLGKLCAGAGANADLE